MRSSSTGMFAEYSDMGRGSFSRMALKISLMPSPEKGVLPVNILYKTIPREKRSERLSMGRPWSCSGDM